MFKVLSLSAIVPALLGGITEPIVYGLSVKYKTIDCPNNRRWNCWSFHGSNADKGDCLCFSSINNVTSLLGDTFVYYLIGIALAFFLSAILTFAFGLGEESSSSNEETEGQVNTISLPLDGEVIELEKSTIQCFQKNDG